jgi:hypothetical protein
MGTFISKNLKKTTKFIDAKGNVSKTGGSMKEMQEARAKRLGLKK